MSWSRGHVIASVRAALAAELDAVERIARMAVDEATGDESKAENQYDTRSLEASYLARGQAERVGALRRLVAWLATLDAPAGGRVGLGSVVEIDDEGPRTVFVVPDGGGRSIDVDGAAVLLVTPGAPLGRALLGASPGDDVVVTQGDVERDVEVVRVG